MILLGLSIVVLIGFVGLVVDLGHLFIAKTELQNAMDACALAAARELDGAPDALVRAENAGITVAQRNLVNFQSTAVTLLPDDVTYNTNLNPPAVPPYLSRLGGADPATAKYAMCTFPASKLSMTMYFMQVMGFSSEGVSAMAVATREPAQSTCAVPLGMCKQPGPPYLPCTVPGAVPDAYGFCKGQWYNGKFKDGGGSWNWIDFTPPSGGESELAGLLTGQGQCNLAVGNNVGQTGNMGNAAAQAWNSRFGIYQGAANSNNPEYVALADYTGFSYTATPAGLTNWPSQSNALSDFKAHRVTHAQYQGDGPSPGTGLNLGFPPNNNKTVAELANGADRRVVTAPIVNCPANNVPILAWACVLLLHPVGTPNDTVYMEYEGLANVFGSPCASMGVGGGTGPLVPVLVQ